MDKQAVSPVLVLVNSMGTDDKLLLMEISISSNCNIVFLSAMCSSRKYPYPPRKGNGNSEGVGGGLQWKFQGAGGLKQKCPPWEDGYGYLLELHNCFRCHKYSHAGWKIRDGFRCSSKWWFAHPEPKKRRRPGIEILNSVFLSPTGSSLA